MNKLSHSSASKFQSCPQEWKFYYKDKIRTEKESGALLFGKALDDAITHMMRQKQFPNDLKLFEKTPLDIFEQSWEKQKILKQDEYLPTSLKIVYSESDYDEDLLLEKDLVFLKEKYKLDNVKKTIKQILKLKSKFGFANLPDLEKEILNHSNWFVMRYKGSLMLQTVEKEILPNIIEVLGVQEVVNLKNDEGDEIIGYADLICRYKGYDNPVILDFKTSTREYPHDAVLTSPQLSLYIHGLFEKFKTRLAGFAILSKRINKNKVKYCEYCKTPGTHKKHRTCDVIIDGKRCNGKWVINIAPEAIHTIMVDSIPTQTEDIVLANMDYINYAIKEGIFHRNFQNCIRPWGKCPYYDLCYKNDMKGLKKVPND